MFNILFTCLLSPLLTSAAFVRFRIRFRVFLVRMCRAWLLRRMIFPEPVTLNLFAALLLVFRLLTTIAPYLSLSTSVKLLGASANIPLKSGGQSPRVQSDTRPGSVSRARLVRAMPRLAFTSLFPHGTQNAGG